jgi:hypothetical protein
MHFSFIVVVFLSGLLAGRAQIPPPVSQEAPQDPFPDRQYKALPHELQEMPRDYLNITLPPSPSGDIGALSGEHRDGGYVLCGQVGVPFESP